MTVAIHPVVLDSFEKRKSTMAAAMQALFSAVHRANRFSHALYKTGLVFLAAGGVAGGVAVFQNGDFWAPATQSAAGAVQLMFSGVAVLCLVLSLLSKLRQLRMLNSMLRVYSWEEMQALALNRPECVAARTLRYLCSETTYSGVVEPILADRDYLCTVAVQAGRSRWLEWTIGSLRAVYGATVFGGCELLAKAWAALK